MGSASIPQLAGMCCAGASLVHVDKIGNDCSLLANGHASLMFTEPHPITLGDRVVIDDSGTREIEKLSRHGGNTALYAGSALRGWAQGCMLYPLLPILDLLGQLRRIGSVQRLGVLGAVELEALL